MTGRSIDFLDLLAERGAGSLHARGRTATRVLLGQAPDSVAGSVLEIGCGTGETTVQMVRLADRVVAVDVSFLMLEAARNRSRFCAADRSIDLVRVAGGHGLPFSDGAFGLIVIESVLAIQTPETRQRILGEIRRLIRPRGRVLINETVWLASTPRPEAERINRRSKERVGMMQATTDPFDADAWVAVFEAAGLAVVSRCRVDDLPHPSKISMVADPLVVRSRIFTAWKKVQRAVRRTGRADQRRLKRVLAELTPPTPCLEGVLFGLEPRP
ncbi:MAG: class I SAM-dependent methyltransferase [Candidatus Sulfomarinibacteraceae bacterium]